MRFWKQNTELLNNQTIKFLPEPWKTQVENNEIELEQVPEDIRLKAMDEGIVDYEASLIDRADNFREERLCEAG